MHRNQNEVFFARPLGSHFDLTYSVYESPRWKYTLRSVPVSVKEATPSGMNKRHHHGQKCTRQQFETSRP